MLKRFVADEGAATAVEYGLMVALIAAVIILATTSLGEKVKTIFEKTDGAMPVPA